MTDNTAQSVLKSKWKTNITSRFRKFENRTGAIICFLVLHAPTPVEGAVRSWTYATGNKSFEDTLCWICSLIKKTRNSGPKDIQMDFTDDMNKFMGCLKPELAHVLEDVAVELASEDNELSALEAEIAELSVKPMSKDQRAAVDQLARTELKIAMMKVIGAWKQTEFTLPEHQADSSAAEVASLE